MSKDRQNIWVVVLVESGVPTLVEAYRDRAAAKAREQSLRETMRPDYDELGLFEVEIGSQAYKEYSSGQVLQAPSHQELTHGD
jgi:hypothetical protein